MSVNEALQEERKKLLIKAQERLKEKKELEYFDDAKKYMIDYLEFKNILNHDIYSSCQSFFKPRHFTLAAEFTIHKAALTFTKMKIELNKEKNKQRYDELCIDLIADLLLFKEHANVKILRLSNITQMVFCGEAELWIKLIVIYINNHLGDGEYAGLC